MQEPWNSLISGIRALDLLHWALIGLNLVLMLFAPLVLRLLGGSKEKRGMSVHIFRALNLLILLTLLFSQVLLPVLGDSLFTRLIAIFVAAYIYYLLFHVLSWFIKRRFGRQREVEDEIVWVETYNSRVLTLLAAVLVSVIGIISLIQILGYTSLLQAGGVVGFIGVLLALTQGAWAPDIISGLVILNSRLFEEGDVIELREPGDILGVVFKTKVFHSELLDLVGNHRIVLQNARVRGMTIRNYSRFASARGLREQMRFKIGYDVPAARVGRLFDSAFEHAVADKDIAIEEQYPLELRACEAGDYAVEWCLFYYTKDVRNMLKTRQLFLGVILEAAAREGIGLATPVLYAPPPLSAPTGAVDS